MCLMCVGLFAQTNSYTRLADFNAARTNSKVYALKTTRSPLYWNTTNNELAGYWTAESQGLKGNLANVSDQFQQFAFLRTENTAAERYYMWSVAGQCFVTIAGAKSEEPVANVWLKDVTDKDNASHLGMKLYIGETGDNVVNVTYWNNNTAGGVRYNTNTEADAGNVYEFIALDADVDLTVAMNKINELEGNPTPEPTVLPDPIEASAFVAGKNYLIENVVANKYLYNDGNALKLGTIADLANIPSQYLFAAVEITGGVALMASNGEYVSGTGVNGTVLTTTATPTAVNVSAKGGTYPATTLNVVVSGNYWNIKGGADGSELCFWDDQNDVNGVWEFRNMGDSGVVGPEPEPVTFPYVVTDVNKLDFSCLYTIDQPHHSKGATSWAVGNDALKSNVDLSKGIDATDPAQQFAFYSTDDGTTVYLYHPASKKYINLDGSLGNEPLNPVSFSNGYYANTFVLKFDNNHYINVGGSKQMVIDDWSTADGGNSCRITAIGEFDPNEATSTVLVDKAEQALALTGVGYPAADAAERTALEDALAALKNEATQENRDALSAKLTAYAATTNVKMPENGKAYLIKAKYNDGSYRYVYRNNEGKLQVASDPAAGWAGTFIFKNLEGGKYAVVNNYGEYMVFYADGKHGVGGTTTGFVGQYENGEYDAELEFITAVNKSATHGTKDNWMGAFLIKARNVDDVTFNYLLAGDPNFHNDYAEAIYYQGGNRSSVFCLEEVEYPNTPELKAAAGLDVAALATFSAPFATVVPEGVTAWYASESEGGSVVMKEVEGAIPANQGVVLSGDLGNVTMVPAAAEAQAELTGGNVLVGTAGAAKDFTSNEGVYILGNKGGQVAFYPLADGTQTLGMNKAYLQLATGGAVVKMNFGGESTGIVAVEKGLNENAPIYDLSGRRVLNTVKGGVYIQAGRKFIVK